MGSKAIVKANISEEVYKALVRIDRFNVATQESIRKAVREKTLEVYRLTIAHAPYKKGKLKSSIQMEIGNTKRGTQGIVKTDDPVAHLVENGTAHSVVIPVVKKALHPGGSDHYFKRAVIPPRRAHPFMRPAMDAVRPTIEQAVKEAIEKNGT